YTRVTFGVSMSPPVASMSITSEPESEEVTKKNTTTMTASSEVIVAHGMECKSSNSEVSKSSSPSGATSPCSRCRLIAESPKMVNHTVAIRVGAMIVPSTNWRIVRPREMRAMNMPTNGAQLIHQPQ